MTFSSYLLERLNIVGARQSDLAREMSLRGIPVSPSCLSMWCSGKRTPRGDSLRMILDLLGVINREERLRAYELAAASSVDSGAKAPETA